MNTEEIEHSEIPVLKTVNLNFWYSDKKVLDDINISIDENTVTSIIGPSGCGKSTLLKCFNRMNDLIKGVKVQGDILFQGESIMGRKIDPTEIRYRIGMVFQRPNPFPKSIFDNVAFGLRINGFKGDISEIVKESLLKANLWDEVKDRLRASALALSGGQQQRLCIARAIAVGPEVLLMDEPCSSLDPVATERIEELISELKQEYTVVIVTHNMQQASRVSDYTGFLLSEQKDGKLTGGRLIEFGKTRQIFTNPKDSRTEAYITGRFG